MKNERFLALLIIGLVLAAGCTGGEDVEVDTGDVKVDVSGDDVNVDTGDVSVETDGDGAKVDTGDYEVDTEDLDLPV